MEYLNKTFNYANVCNIATGNIVRTGQILVDTTAISKRCISR